MQSQTFLIGLNQSLTSATQSHLGLNAIQLSDDMIWAIGFSISVSWVGIEIIKELFFPTWFEYREGSQSTKNHDEAAILSIAFGILGNIINLFSQFAPVSTLADRIAKLVLFTLGLIIDLIGLYIGAAFLKEELEIMPAIGVVINSIAILLNIYFNRSI